MDAGERPTDEELADIVAVILSGSSMRYGAWMKLSYVTAKGYYDEESYRMLLASQFAEADDTEISLIWKFVWVAYGVGEGVTVLPEFAPGRPVQGLPLNLEEEKLLRRLIQSKSPTERAKGAVYLMRPKDLSREKAKRLVEMATKRVRYEEDPRYRRYWRAISDVIIERHPSLIVR